MTAVLPPYCSSLSCCRLGAPQSAAGTGHAAFVDDRSRGEESSRLTTARRFPTTSHETQDHDEVCYRQQTPSSELATGYVSTLGNRTNDALQLLTLMASLFIPLTVVTGWHEMTVDHVVALSNLPDLRWY